MNQSLKLKSEIEKLDLTDEVKDKIYELIDFEMRTAAAKAENEIHLLSGLTPRRVDRNKVME